MNKISLIFVAVMLSIVFFNGGNLFGMDRVKKIRLKGAIKESTPKAVTILELEKLPLTEYSVFNPYRKERKTYKGVLMKDMVNAFGEPGVTKISIIAVDGYHSEFVEDEWLKWDILFAIKSDGKLMGPDVNGPVKVVMPYDTSPEMDRILYEPKWIWAIKTIIFSK